MEQITQKTILIHPLSLITHPPAAFSSPPVLPLEGFTFDLSPLTIQSVNSIGQYSQFTIINHK